MSAIDDLILRAKVYQSSFQKGHLAPEPTRKVTVVSCMDARINLYGLFGLEEGEAHIIRNAGGIVTDDTIRSLAISQNFLGTEEILLLQHTGCGMLTVDDAEFRHHLVETTGHAPTWSAGAFTDIKASLLSSIASIEACPFIVFKHVRGFIYDVDNGAVREVIA